MTSGSGISRREALAAGGVGLVLAGSAAPLSAGQNAIPAADEERGVKVTEATNVALAASPDGAMLALDLLGILWTMPVTGGKLTRLTGDFDDLGQPDWSPDGSQIIVQSYRTGNFHIWSVPSGGGEMIQLTDGACDDREPRWSPDGKWIAFSSDRSEGRYAIHILELATGKVALFSHGETQDSEPCWAPDGKSIAYVADGGKIMVAPLGGGEAAVVASVEPSPDFFRKQELHAPAYGPDGAIWYTRMAGGKMDLIREGTVVPAGDDLYPFRPAWAAGALIYGADGTLWSMDAKGAKKAIAFEASAPVTRPDYARKTRDFDSSAPRPVVGIVAPALSPDGRQIAFGALNDLWLMDIGSAPRKLVSGPSYKCDPEIGRAHV